MQRRHRVSWCVSSCAFVLVASSAAFAGDLAVPRDYRTIEDALAVAAPGDRVVVRGGKFENVLVKKGNVSIVAKGTTVVGYVWIDGSNVSMSGMRLGSHGRIVVTGDDVTVTGTKATGRGQRAISVQGGRRAHLEGNKLASGDIEVLRGSDAQIVGNKLKDGTVIASGSVGVDIESNVAPGISVTGAEVSLLDNRCGDLQADANSCDVANNVVSGQISVTGDAASLQGNDVKGWVHVRGDDAALADNSLVGGGIDVTGDRASIVANTVDQSPLGIGVHGNDFTIAINDVTAYASLMHDGQSAAGFAFCPGIASTGTDTGGGTITDNTVTHYNGVGISVASSNVAVTGNDVHGVSSNTSITIVGAQNTIADNSVAQTSVGQGTGDGIDVRGDGNTLSGNDIGVVAQDAILVMSGAGNVITSNTIDSAPGCGVVLTCRSTGTVISDCVVNGCGLGVVNDGVSTSMTGTTSQANDFADILDLSTGFGTFENNTYTTISHDQLLAPAVTQPTVID